MLLDEQQVGIGRLQRTATCSSRDRRASSGTIGPSACRSAIGSGSGSAPALMRAITNAA